MTWRIVRRASAVGVGALVLVGAAAASVAHLPLGVQSASLTQNGQQLVWSVTLDHPFSGTGLVHDRRSLCLLFEGARSGRPSAEACIAPSASSGGGLTLERSAIAPGGVGPPHAVEATMTRSSSSNVTASFTPASVGLTFRSLRWQVASGLRPPGCVRAPSADTHCTVVYPAKPALARLHTPKLVGCTPSGPAYVTNGTSSKREIALTFDDGPWTLTSQFLNLFEREHVVATFFEIGEQISTFGENGAIERRMLADGDMIGDHTWNHADVRGAGSFAAGEISQAAAAIKHATGGFQPCLFRAPFGNVSGPLISEARSMGFTTIEWDIDPRDWALPGISSIYDNVIANAHNGAIVIQHDGGGNRSETLAALPQEIATLRSRGYTFVTVTEMLGQKLIYK